MTSLIPLSDDTASGADRLRAAPREVVARLSDWLPDAPPEELVPTLEQFAGLADYLRRLDPIAQAEALRAARLTEWELARRWPSNPTGVYQEDRPGIRARTPENNQAWQRVYQVGQVDRDWIRNASEAKYLTQRAVIRQVEQNELAQRPIPDLTTLDTFDLILADPPWRYDFTETTSRQIENQYPTMDVPELADLQVPAADDCVLFCWATSPKLREALAVIEAWGFTYLTNAVWVKNKIGMGYYFRQQHELLLVAKKGEPPVPAPADRPPSIIEGDRTEHSAKPDHVHDLIDRMYPGRSKVELFARGHRDGWAAWGNQA
jgi:N6-adenosine-specific RNA methylase IME4